MHPIVLAAIGGGVAQVPDVQSLSDPLASVIGPPGGDRPITSVKFKTDGDIEEATGDTGGALSYSKVGEVVDPVGGFNGVDWQINFTVNSEDNGDPGTWSGSTRGSYIDLATERTFTWTKDANDQGTANSVVTVTVRAVADTSNSDTKSNIDHDATITP